MKVSVGRVLVLGWTGAAILAGLATSAVSAPLVLASVGRVDRPPLGWVEFCAEQPRDCRPSGATVLEFALTGEKWNELVRINKAVNDSIQPVTDLDHFGVIEKWSYPDDGYGDCEDYVLLKRRTLVEAGWPTSVLLVTVVRDEKGGGHAVLTVKTNKGELVLDNQNPAILPWSDTPYRYVKRQSQSNPNVWVSIGDTRPSVATVASQ
jgi:predicted transglutaminase-like cysteine proteinase